MGSNFHGVALVLGDHGVLIAGRSGAGKTALGLALVAHVRSFGWFARFVADDQVFLSVCHGRLVCAAPQTISGLAEIWGIGPRRVEFEPRARIDLMVRLAARENSPRFQEPRTEMLEGCAMPSLTLAEDDRQGGLFAVASSLGLPPFG